MRHVTYKLKPLVLDRAQPRPKAYTLADGGGLLIEVLPTGTKVWRYRCSVAGKREKVTIGTYPEVSMKAARDRHAELRALVEAGQSPTAAKQAQEAAKAAQDATRVTFQAFAMRWVADTLFYRSAGYRAQTVRWLEVYVNPTIGDKLLTDVQPADVLAILEKPDLARYAVTAERVRVIIQQVCNHAIRKLLLTHNPATAMRGAIQRPPVEHHRHLVGPEVGAFWRALGEQRAHATTTAAARLLLLTMARKRELLRSTWSEFDLEAGVWDVPKERMKMGRPHRVFLSTQAVRLLRELEPLTGGSPAGYVFPSIYQRSVPMGDATLNHLFKRLDVAEDFSPHGLRGTAATLLREHGFGRDVVELLLAHAEKDATVAAYSHMELAAERRKALQWLADQVERLAAGAEVVRLRA